MNESIKTAIFVVAAAVFALITWISWKVTAVPEFSEPARVAMEGKPLFPKFTDPWAATSLEIVKYDEQTASPVPFQVAQIEGQWSIPSHSNYPTDAKDQLAEAASSMMGLEVVDMASDDPDTHEMYGVVDPSSKPASTAPEDVGVRVVMRDKNDEVLMGLIIGKKVGDSDDLRYVRVLGENPVYTVAVKTDKLSNKFEDWIEEDFLKLNSWDIRQIHIQDYSMVERGGRYYTSPGAQMTLKYNDTGDPKWSLVEDMVFSPDEGKMVPGKMGDDEELDTEKLNDMKSNLDDLEIVDVRRKPPGLSADLRAAGTMMNDLETVLSLQNKGFYLVQVPVQDKVYLDVLSNQGELRVSMKDGVQYVLRFGEIASGTAETGEEKETPQKETSDDSEAKKEAADDSEAKEKSKDSETKGLNRYLFVMARFDASMIPEPELEPLPEAEPPAADDQPGEEKVKEEATEGEEPGEEKAKEEATEGEEPGDEEAETTDDAAAEEGTSDDDEASDQSDEKKDADEEKSKLEEERKRIEKENKRKQEEYDEKVKEGKKHVDELNERFADWYYVIADDVYQKVRLARSDIIKKKDKGEDEDKEEADQEAAGAEPAEEGNTVSDFEKLKQEGLEGGEE